MTVDFKRLEPKSNIIKSIVVFFHGYGADGADLLSIGSVLSEHLPNTLFVAPDAPTKCQMSPFGFQWNKVLRGMFFLISKFLSAFNAINLFSFLKGITSHTVANRTYIK